MSMFFHDWVAALWPFLRHPVHVEGARGTPTRRKRKRGTGVQRRQWHRPGLATACPWNSAYSSVPRKVPLAHRRHRTLPDHRPPGFEKPSAIQSKGIVPFTKGLDVIQQAQSGTGKTATFCAGILNNLDYNLNECQALVLAPTRELAQQIEKVMRALGDFLQVKCHACVGGTSVREDARILGAGVQVRGRCSGGAWTDGEGRGGWRGAGSADGRGMAERRGEGGRAERFYPGRLAAADGAGWRTGSGVACKGLGSSSSRS